MGSKRGFYGKHMRGQSGKRRTKVLQKKVTEKLWRSKPIISSVDKQKPTSLQGPSACDQVRKEDYLESFEEKGSNIKKQDSRGRGKGTAAKSGLKETRGSIDRLGEGKITEPLKGWEDKKGCKVLRGGAL